MRKITRNTILILLFLTLGIFTVLLTYLHFFASDDRNLSGEWVAELDMAEQAAARAFVWLQDIEAVSVSLEDMESCMEGLTIQVNLILEQTASSEGTFYSTILPENYDACNEAAYEALAVAFRELTAERLRMAGYTGSTEGEAVEALAAEAFGMPTVSYLMSCGPVLLPSLEELQAQYDGSGTYEAAEGILARQFDDGRPAAAMAERYIRKGSNLILSENVDLGTSGHYPVVYTLEQSQEP